ncbi:AI-2E family transporter [Sinimarinibacterium sp. CAU 1509]|uniref:AI-2E family transporter n=1 Tax=Sinimarinibacterium sp. CAU 1509 TaxID=2562283 RepID=UPI0010AD5864|nr:AI-2E family transporter [Sinimarinibacterium sp. CAU 1509]TJY60953.1 AI-2E family transporter [Sinimarinibacterium sp. CAU 1509]
MNPSPHARLNTELLVQFGLIVLLVGGCWMVLQPFFAAILFAIIVVASTWPAYEWLLRQLGGRSILASVIACAATVLLAMVPATLLLMSLIDGVVWGAQLVGHWRDSGGAQPEWVARVPLIGAHLSQWWQEAGSNDANQLGKLLAAAVTPARQLAVASGRMVGNALLQTALIVLLLYYLYRSGHALQHALLRATDRIAGAVGRELLTTARRTVASVMLSIVGAGLAQAMIATLGYAIAGVPNPFLLGALTLVLSLIAFGPPLLWIGASIWLFRHGDTGWAIFMLIYGALAISSIDNLLKPLIISRANHLSFVMTLMGVIGGIFAFGIIGVFLGPALLALAINLSAHWLQRSGGNGAAPSPIAIHDDTSRSDA